MNLEKAAFIGLLTAVTLAFFGLLSGFVQPLFWSATLAVIFQPVHAKALSLTSRRRNTAALLTLLVVCITVIIPSWFVATSVLTEATSFYTRVESGELNPAAALDWVRAQLPAVNDFLARVGVTPESIRENLSSAAVKGSQFVGSLAVTTGQNVARFAVQFAVMLYVLYFFIRDGDRLLEVLIIALPLGDERERALLTKFAEVSRATVKGTLVIGLIQGSLGGLIFWVLGIEGASFWGVVMVILSLLPVVGSALVWGPAAVIMAANQQFVDAGILLAFGVVVIGLVDNVLRPILVGRDTRMPDYLVLLSTLGGLTVFGASGFVIGPIIAALFLSTWVMFAHEHSGWDLSLPNPAADSAAAESEADTGTDAER
ncbi:MAG: AI-2E family transporter [Gammaproteobacteria bacterium]|nr:AI-2E family transporter [Gammaproteobacteria bacterium]